MSDASVGLQTTRSFSVSEPHRLLSTGPPETSMSPRVLAHVLLLSVLLTCSLTLEDEDEDEDVTVNQMLAPRVQDSDATEILNNLLKEYDKKLRPDIGGNAEHTQDPTSSCSYYGMYERVCVCVCV
ncbi:gamma-aminobutyric acid receptor subunit gamma-3-like [Anarrhichthys ocellatus]|uniref:gamma-aminobutyric acid receptor subunit gamma-3-like n=1 Tax=Anarrhichthys ocellatus TaxID=433405 RepID=UPI0012ECBF29|nr:gamma-aminobutyric acid receptor subunit gamma-3-like [Anarrhichthys ocellatus]